MKKKGFSQKHIPGFPNSDALYSWYGRQFKLQKGCCYYCQTSIDLINTLIAKGLLKTRAVRGDGMRGPSLEIDKLVNELGYSATNCVLACYYCNNDKSYIFSPDQYKKYFGPSRNKLFSDLALELNK